MPGRTGRMINGVPSLAVTGLQRNVIGMAFCCKKGRWSEVGATATAKATRIARYCRITVLRRDGVVVLCVSISFVALVSAATEPTSIRKTTTERALTSSRPWARERRSISMLLPVVCSVSLSQRQVIRLHQCGNYFRLYAHATTLRALRLYRLASRV